MKISYNWLKDIIDTGLTVERTGELLTGCGLEVEGIEKYESLKGGLEGIVVGEVKTCAKHPNADKLSVTTVDVGGPELLHIVCGAPNVAAGQKVLVATVGTTVHPTKGEPFEIKKSKIRGEVSEGMICAEDELGLGESHDGILVLPAHYETGKKAIEYFPVYTDYLVEIGLTANRGDAASHLGVARDLKALTGKDLQPAYKNIAAPAGNDSPAIKIHITDTEGCIRYSGISISGVTVKPSPEWMQNRLKTIGLSPINNIVDITNYVLHELGQPLHAFDADKIAGNTIEVKTLPAGTKFTTLDQVERTLNGNECMICDAEKALAIGGVFGGLDSGITSNTKNIFIESACFSPVSVRKTAKHHGLSTDASFRFERGTDPNMPLPALSRAIELVLELADGSVSSAVTDVYPAPVANTTVVFNIPKFNKLIGQVIPVDEIKNILAGLDIQITEETSDQFTLSVPPFRVDVKRDADIAEEILRIYGLNKIDIPQRVTSAISGSESSKAGRLKHRLADYLADQGFHEMLNNSLTRSAYYTEDEVKDAVRLLNPLSNDLDIMRLSMLYNGLEVIQYNRNRKAADLKLFEFGKTYARKENGYDEREHLALFITGMKHDESWQGDQQQVTFFSLKSTLENLLKKAGVNKYEYHFENIAGLHASGKIKTGHDTLVTFGSVPNNLLKKFDTENAVWYADIDWQKLSDLGLNQQFKLKPVSAFPAVRRDLALVLDKAVKYADIAKLARKAEPQLIKQVNVFDVYEGDKIGEGKKSYAISFILQDEHKTLTDQEIDAVMQKLVKLFEKELNAVLRA